MVKYFQRNNIWPSVVKTCQIPYFYIIFSLPQTNPRTIPQTIPWTSPQINPRTIPQTNPKPMPKPFPKPFPKPIPKPFPKVMAISKVESDWLALYHSISNVKFPPITALLNRSTYPESA